MNPCHLLCVISLGIALTIVHAAVLTRATTQSQLTIGAFNIQNLGPKKIGNQQVYSIIIKLLSRFDIVLVQEIVDRQEGIADQILQELNRANGKNIYNVALSPRIGRSLQKEQYGFFYRTDKVKVLKEYVYNDKENHYEREPYIVTFQPRSRNYPSTGLSLVPIAEGLANFTMVGIHIKPSDAVAELQQLHHVVESAVENDSENVILLGDFNADCAFVRKKYWPTIQLWTDEKYMWLIPHDADTTATPSDCAYDRIIARGEEIQKAIIPESATAIRFEEEYRLPEELALLVSDHYPVQVDVDLSKRRQG